MLFGHGVCDSSLEAASQELPLHVLQPSHDRHWVTDGGKEKRVLPPPLPVLCRMTAVRVVYLRSTYKLDTITGYLRDRDVMCCRF